MNLWSREVGVLLALVVLGTLLVLLHLAICLRAFRSPSVPAWLRWLAWVPPLTPYAGLRARARFLSVTWLIVGLAYFVLRSVP